MTAAPSYTCVLACASVPSAFEGLGLCSVRNDLPRKWNAGAPKHHLSLLSLRLTSLDILSSLSAVSPWSLPSSSTPVITMS